MPYRATASTRKNAEDKRHSLLTAARAVVASGGFTAATVAAIAGRCVAGGGFRPQDPRLASSAVMGAVSEALVGWTRPEGPEPSSAEQAGALDGIRTFCFRALGAEVAGPPFAEESS